MKTLLLNGRMALLRKTSCLLTVLFSLVAAVFLLVYPLFIDSAREELAYAYDSVEVTGWLYNGDGFQDPDIPGETWHALLDTGFIGAHYSYSSAEARLFDVGLYSHLPAMPEQAIALFEQTEETLLKNRDKKNTAWKTVKILNNVQSHDGLYRIKHDIRWVEGWSSDDFFSGAEQVCLVASDLGYQPGDLVPIRLRTPFNRHAVFCFQAVGIFPHPSGVGDVDLVLPLPTAEAICTEQGEDWPFWVNGCSFLVNDNRSIPDLKRAIIDLGLTRGDIRAAIDDRVLDGTVSPIKSNLALLQGLYRFFFGVVAAIGFFLCFLLARGRRQEYAVMRLLGESALRVTGKAILEQLLLCLTGVAMGAAILAAAGQGSVDLAVCGVILLCYTLGAAAAVLLTVRVDVMEILRDKE